MGKNDAAILAAAAKILAAQTREAGDFISGGIREQLAEQRIAGMRKTLDVMKLSRSRRGVAEAEDADKE
jgi:hypothetical protein